MGNENFDFMEYIKQLLEQIEYSVAEGQENTTYVLLSRYLFYISELYGEKMIDKFIYRDALAFYKKMHKLLLSQSMNADFKE